MPSSSKEKQREYDAKRQGKRTRGWACIVYPESAPSNWRELLDDKHIPAFISPLHDKDLNADETQKKPHWHVLIMFSSPASENQANAVFNGLNGTIPQAVTSLEGYARYLIHADNPEKTQYNKEDIQCLCGANWYEVAYKTEMDDMILDEIEAFIDAAGYVSYSLFCAYAREFRPDWRGTIRRRTTHLTGYMRSFLWEFEGHPGRIPPREKWKQAEHKPEEPKDDFNLKGFTVDENEIRTKRGEFKD